MAVSDTWTVKKPGAPGGVVSSVKNCGYSEKLLVLLRLNGYRLYKNGKPVPKKEWAG